MASAHPTMALAVKWKHRRDVFDRERLFKPLEEEFDSNHDLA
jgi:hypothetical protein